MPELLPVGTIVKIKDRVCDDVSVLATVKFVEPDNDFPNLYWYYFVANEGLSVIENLGQCGVPIPASIKKALKALNKESK